MGAIEPVRSLCAGVGGGFQEVFNQGGLAASDGHRSGTESLGLVWGTM